MWFQISILVHALLPYIRITHSSLKDYCYITGGYSDITVSAGQTRVPLGAARNDISAIQVCTPKNIAGDTKTFDPLVRMRCA